MNQNNLNFQFIFLNELFTIGVKTSLVFVGIDDDVDTYVDKNSEVDCLCGCLCVKTHIYTPPPITTYLPTLPPRHLRLPLLNTTPSCFNHHSSFLHKNNNTTPGIENCNIIFIGGYQLHLHEGGGFRACKIWLANLIVGKMKNKRGWDVVYPDMVVVPTGEEGLCSRSKRMATVVVMRKKTRTIWRWWWYDGRNGLVKWWFREWAKEERGSRDIRWLLVVEVNEEDGVGGSGGFGVGVGGGGGGDGVCVCIICCFVRFF